MSDPEDGNNKRLQSLLEEVNETVAKRQKILDERKNELEKERTSFEEEKRLFGAGKGSASDLMRLNVAGKRMHVLRRTLTLIEGSMLASQFSGRWDDNLVKDEEGYIFIDQPSDLFEALLDFLRRKASETPRSMPAEPPSLAYFGGSEKRYRDFIRLVEYYGLTHGVFVHKLEQYYGESGDLEIQNNKTAFSPGMQITAKSFCGIKIVPAVTSEFRKVASFEIFASKADVTDLQLGFMQKTSQPDKALDYLPRVGTIEWSLGFDLLRFGTYINTPDSFEEVERSGIDGENSVRIRVERIGAKFCVNGKEIATFEYDEDCDDVPAISGIGTWRITELTLDDVECVAGSLDDDVTEASSLNEEDE